MKIRAQVKAQQKKTEIKMNSTRQTESPSNDNVWLCQTRACSEEERDLLDGSLSPGEEDRV